jgi:hypothetical protein
MGLIIYGIGAWLTAELVRQSALADKDHDWWESTCGNSPWVWNIGTAIFTLLLLVGWWVILPLNVAQNLRRRRTRR